MTAESPPAGARSSSPTTPIEVAGQGVGGGAGMASGLDVDGAAAAGGADDFLD